ncbi:MAG: hypothetical protein KF900_03675 [Bacteroidetes bacterium]|nr:hypothetical protein [Bacteroidota bacterium]
MKLTINDSRKISSIQKKFNDEFPYLKIEFFSKPHKIGGSSPKKLMMESSKTLGECRTVHKSGTISIVPQMTVGELEQNFKDMFGLWVQVFRKSGRVWLETSVTDNWTLEKQNTKGEELSKTFAEKKIIKAY